MGNGFPPSPAGPRRSPGLVVLTMLTFFVISLVTNVIGAINADVGRSFGLSLTFVGLLAFAFFVAYGVMSIPAGLLVERCREKPVMVAAFGLALAGALLISLWPSYPVFLASLFLIGAGFAALQVVINPLLRVAGGEEHYAFNSVLAQLIFGGASFLSPFIYSYFVRNIGRPGAEGKPLVGLMTRLVRPGLAWVSVYWVFAAILLAMIAVLAAVRFPVVERREDERAGAWAVHRALFRDRTVVLYFLGIFAYVGTEQGVSFWISKFLQTYHGYDQQTVGAQRVALFWLLMTLGGILGLGLLKLFDSRRVLVAFTAAALVFLTLALFGPGPLALVMFPLLGFAASVMWPIIFSLALNSVAGRHGAFSGILCTGIVGGAIWPLIIGRVGDAFGLRQGLFVLYLTLGYILSIGLWARPLIANRTIALRKRERKAAA
ncbi:MAG TPA: MFS transporter [Candidatus Aminicenantes bacterium]|nr:MFS transporter [Candidatus Aminicenantes bacterium]HRY64991.1 MFS transporter [Candidatus Aminicenantes bacterium]HRZ71904.1 MFS transporter [Candidatus Aminicenantes bacterium]